MCKLKNAHEHSRMETYLLWLKLAPRVCEEVQVWKGLCRNGDEPADLRAGSRKLEQRHVKSWFERCLWWQTAVSSAVSFKWFLCQAEWRG